MADLRRYLDRILNQYHQTPFLSSDPLEFAHLFKDPWDQEAVALLGAVLAYGNVTQIRKSIKTALDHMEGLTDSPQAFVRSLSHPRFLKKAEDVFKSYVHRFNRGIDLIILFKLLNQSWSKHGSLGSHFLSFLRAGDSDISQALDQFISEWRRWITPPSSPTFSYLLTAPSDGSCCKRWCMFLRWMGRKDSVDLGLWTQGSPLSHTFPKGKFLKSSQLVMPLDTHTGRISQNLKLTSRKSLNWKAAIEVTEALKRFDPDDPIRYDFALCRVGMMETSRL